MIIILELLFGFFLYFFNLIQFVRHVLYKNDIFHLSFLKQRSSLTITTMVTSINNIKTESNNQSNNAIRPSAVTQQQNTYPSNSTTNFESEDQPKTMKILVVFFVLLWIITFFIGIHQQRKSKLFFFLSFIIINFTLLWMPLIDLILILIVNRGMFIVNRAIIWNQKMKVMLIYNGNIKIVCKRFESGTNCRTNPRQNQSPLL